MENPRHSTLVGHGAVFLAILAVVCIGVPGSCAAIELIRAAMSDGSVLASAATVDIEKTASTVIWAMLVAVVSALLAFPGAVVLRRRGWKPLPWMLIPLLMPSYLAYSGWGLLRAPGTVIGDWAGRMVSEGATWVPLAMGRALAVGGLALWAWPIALIVMGSGFAKIDPAVVESMRLDGGRFIARIATKANLVFPAFVAGAGAVMLLMIGSPVPFHLAQVPTVAMDVWLRLVESPGNASAWAAAWPLILTAVVAGWKLGGAAANTDAISGQSLERAHRWASLPFGFAATVWALAVIVPLVLFVMSIRDFGEFVLQWNLNKEAISDSAATAACVSVGVSLVSVLTWAGLSDRRALSRSMTRVCVRAMLIAGLMPGVLVGSAVWRAVEAVGLPLRLDQTIVPLVIGHLARFSFVGALVGCYLARLDTREERDTREMDGVKGVRAWWEAVMPRQTGSLLGIGAAAFCLSLHEIESVVLLAPPGGGGMAPRMLNWLHFFKTEELSVISVMMIGSGFIVAACGACALRWNSTSTRSRP